MPVSRSMEPSAAIACQAQTRGCRRFHARAPGAVRITAGSVRARAGLGLGEAGAAGVRGLDVAFGQTLAFKIC